MPLMSVFPGVVFLCELTGRGDGEERRPAGPSKTSIQLQHGQILPSNISIRMLSPLDADSILNVKICLFSGSSGNSALTAHAACAGHSLILCVPITCGSLSE